ncbi:hypothetical protein [Brachybacterium epidermidis]|uniref:hypothetical protein n=1 Tax=Brachybacterium epidermidis TaxID=2781983 RepID=UPI00398E49A0
MDEDRRTEWSDALPFQESLAGGEDPRSAWTTDPSDAGAWPEELAYPQQQATARADARAFARIGGPAAARFFGMGDVESTADAMLHHRFAGRTGPLAEKQRQHYFAEEQEKRKEEYDQAIPRQDVAGLRASLIVSTGMFLLVAAAIAAIRAMGALLSPDPLPTSRQMIAGMNGPAALEVLLTAPVVLIPLYLLFHLTVLWRARTHARAALLVAADDDRAGSMGLPVVSPLQGIWASWSFLLRCIGGLLMVYLVGAFFAAALNSYASWLSWERFETLGIVSPAAWACLLPTIAAGVLAWWRAKVAARRKELMLSRMYEDN